MFHVKHDEKKESPVGDSLFCRRIRRRLRVECDVGYVIVVLQVVFSYKDCIVS